MFKELHEQAQHAEGTHCCSERETEQNTVSISCHADASRMTSLTAVCFNVDHISWEHFFLLQAVIDRGVQLELLSALHCLQANDDMRDDFAVTSCLQSTVSACNVLYTLLAEPQSRHPTAVVVSFGG